MVSPPSGGKSARETHETVVSSSGRSSTSRAKARQNEFAPTKPPITLAFVLRALRRWWKIATPVGVVLGLLVAGVFYLTYVPLYRAESWIQIKSQQPFVVYPEHGRNSAFERTQVELIKSPVIIQPVLSHKGIAAYPEIQGQVDPVMWLSQRISVRSTRGSELFVVSFDGPDATRAAEIVNEVVATYFRLQSQDEIKQVRKVIELLDQEAARRADRVTALRESIKVLSAQLGVAASVQTRPSVLEEKTLRTLNDLQQQITKIEIEEKVLEAQQEALDETLATADKSDPPDHLIEDALSRDSEIQNLTVLTARQLAYLEQIAQTSARGKEDTRYRQLEGEYLAKLKALDERKVQIHDLAIEFVRNEAGKKNQAEKASLEARLTVFRVRANALRENYDKVQEELTKQLGNLSKNQLEIEFRKNELEREQKVFEAISERALKLRTELSRPAQVTLLQRAEPRFVPVGLTPYKRLTFAGLATFCLPFAVVVLWERMVRRVDDPQELWQANLTVVGEIAKLPVSSKASSLSSSKHVRDVSLFEESIDSLRTCLVLSEPTNESRVLVISSAVMGEGKTSVASQLAVSIARASGEPTLLIDADMRSPDLHNVFDIPNEPGLAQVLSHECTAEEAIVTSWSNYVHLLPAGVLKTSPHKLLGDGAFKAFLAHVRTSYRHIIIDTSPILSASESLVLAKAADATLLCAMRDVSRVDQVQKAYERLVNTGARPLGTVLNGVPTGRYAYLYGIYAYPRG